MRLTDRMIENTKELNKQLKKQNDIQQKICEIVKDLDPDSEEGELVQEMIMLL